MRCRGVIPVEIPLERLLVMIKSIDFDLGFSNVFLVLFL